MEIDLCPRNRRSRSGPGGPRIIRQAAVEMVARRLRRPPARIPARVPAADASSEVVVLHDRDVLPGRPDYADLPADSGAVLIDRHSAGRDVPERIPATRAAARHLRHRHLSFRAAMVVRSATRARLALA